MERISLGLSGTGVAAEYHSSAIALSSHYQVDAVFSREKRRGREFAYRHGIPNSYDDIEYLYEGSSPDLLLVTGETSRHFPLAMEAMTKGYGVIVAAPLCRTLREAKALLEEAEEDGAFLLEANPLLSKTSLQPLYEMLQKEELGKLKTISFSMHIFRGENYYSPDRWQGQKRHAGGGILMQDGYLGLSLLTDLFGEGKVERVALEDQNEEGVEKSASLLLTFGGVPCSVDFSSLKRDKAFSLQVEGERGTFRLEEEKISLFSSLGRMYEGFTRHLVEGEDLSLSFERILHTYQLLEEIYR